MLYNHQHGRKEQPRNQNHDKNPVTAAQYQVVMLLKFVVTIIPKDAHPTVLGIQSKQ